MLKMKGIKNRILHLRSKSEQTQAEFAEALGVSRSQQAKFETGVTEPPIDYLLALVKKCNVSYAWLFEGLEDLDSPMKIKSQMVRESAGKYIPNSVPLIRVEAFGGIGNSVFNIEEKDIQAYYVVPDFTNVNFMIRVKGSSMYPKYNSGDVIACRILKEIKFIQWGKVYVIATKEQGILIKRLKKAKLETNIIALSDNPSYDPFEIPMNEIEGIAVVMGVIRLE